MLPSQNPADWLKAQAAASPERTALIFSGRTWTYRELEWQVSVLSDQLKSAGILGGQHIAALLPNCPEYILLVHALARLGAVLVPLNQRLNPRELAWQIQHADCSALVYIPATESVARSITPGLTCLDIFQLASAGVGIERLPASEANLVAASPTWGMDQTQSLVFTSGTTGRPKAAQLTFGNHFWSAVASAARLGVNPDDCWLVCLPLFHVGGLAIIFRSCLYASTILLHERFDVQAVLDEVQSGPATITSLVPTMLHRLLEQTGAVNSLTRLRVILLGGAAASPRLLKQGLQADLPLAITYGMTETASQIATASLPEVRRKPGSAGKPLLFNQVRILDDQDRICEAGKIGRVTVCGPIVMKGYYRQPPAPAEFATGDLGYLDQDGDLWIVQRREDLILSGGENVYPSEVEQTLLAHPALKNACVVGLEDDEWGQIVAAALVPYPGVLVSETDLIQHCQERLASFKIPRRFQFFDRLPQTESGKILRRQVIDLMSASIQVS